MDAENLNSRRRFIRIYGTTVAGTVLWLAAIIAAPFLRSRGFGGAGFFYACFAPVCHQIPSRSLFLWGFPLAVCARCFGIYIGFAAGLFLYPFLRGFSSVRLPLLKTFVFVSFPLVLDFAGNILRLWSTSNIPRLLIGFLWGTILPFYFLAGLAGLFAFPHRRDSSVSRPG